MMWLKSIKALSVVASVGLVASAAFMAYIVLFPVDVLTNWKLTIDGDTYYPGDVVVIESTYTKHATVSGVAKRYLECRNDNGVFLRYELNEAKANRAASKQTGTGVTVSIPERLAEITLPTSCFFSVGIEYDVYPRRANYEYNRTQDFILTPEAIPADKPAPVTGSLVKRQEDEKQPLPDSQPTDSIARRQQGHDTRGVVEKIVDAVTDAVRALR